ncbi:hypothetical protein [Streptomyces sp. NPDC002640]
MANIERFQRDHRSGAGFIVLPELSWRHIDAPPMVVHVGQPGLVRRWSPTPCGLSDRTPVGQEIRRTVEETIPIGVFVEFGKSAQSSGLSDCQSIPPTWHTTSRADDAIDEL